MAYTYVELPGSPKLKVDRTNGLTGSRQFRVTWLTAMEFISDIMGGWTVIAGVVARRNPIAFPGYPLLLATVSDFEPFMPAAVTGGTITNLGSGNAQYEYAKVSVEYRVPDPGPEEDSTNDISDTPEGTVLEYSRQVGGQVLSTPGRAWEWKLATGNKKVSSDVNPGIVIPTIVHQLNWSNVPDSLVPWTEIKSTMGRINSLKYLGVAANKLLFSGSSASRMWDLQSLAVGEYQQAWNLSYTFEEQVKPAGAGWNHFWRQEKSGAGDTPASSNWAEIETDESSAQSPYTTASFKALTEFRA